jgi:DNA repair protein RadC
MNSQLNFNFDFEPKFIAGEVALIYKRKFNGQKFQISNSSDTAQIFFNYWDDPETLELKEKFYVMFLNRANMLVALMKVSEGGTSGTVIDIKHIAICGLLVNSCSAIICHNHPSGNLKPSEADIKITTNVKNALHVLDINLLDHIIITPTNQYYSFTDEGLI